MRRWLIIFTPLLLASSEPPRPTMPDVIEAGRVLGGLSDSQAALFVLIFIIVVLVGAWLTSLWFHGQTAKLTAASLDKVAAALDRLVVTVSARDTDTNVNLALIRHGVENLRAGIK